MAIARLNNKQIAIGAGIITVFNYDALTREYINSNNEYLAVGVGLPANSCVDAPPESESGFALRRTADFSGWEQVEDYRGKTAYSIETGSPVVITAPGKLDVTLSLIAPATGYDQWNGTEWITDKTAEQAGAITQAETQRTALINEASARTQLWQTQLMLNIISDADKALLTEWMRYIQELQAVDTAMALNINWPGAPL